MIKQHRTIDSWGLQKVDTNSILTCIVADLLRSAQCSAHQQVHFRHKEEQLLMSHNLLVGSLEAGSCVFNLISWLQVRLMITCVKFQKKTLLLYPLERHTTWTVYFSFYYNQFSPKIDHVSKKHSIYITLVYWEQKLIIFITTHILIMMYIKTAFMRWRPYFQWQENNVRSFNSQW